MSFLIKLKCDGHDVELVGAERRVKYCDKVLEIELDDEVAFTSLPEGWTRHGTFRHRCPEHKEGNQ